MNFEIGQRVVCIQQSKKKLLVVGKEYIVKDISYCCKNEPIDIGMSIPYPYTRFVCSCGGLASETIKYFNSSFFVSIEDMEEAESAVNKLLKGIEKTVELNPILN